MMLEYYLIIALFGKCHPSRGISVTEVPACAHDKFVYARN